MQLFFRNYDSNLTILKRFSGNLFVRAPIHSPWTQKKNFIPYINNVSIKDELIEFHLKDYDCRKIGEGRIQDWANQFQIYIGWK